MSFTLEDYAYYENIVNFLLTIRYNCDTLCLQVSKSINKFKECFYMKSVKEYMDRIEMKYGSPYIQIPKNLIRELSDAMNEEDSISYLAYANGLMIVNGFLYKYAHYIDLDHDDSIGMGNIKELLK